MKEPTLRDGSRPDLVIVLPNSSTVCIDVTVVFELTATSLELAGKEKEHKYSPHAVEIARLAGCNSHPALIYGLAFGARGSIAPKTLNVMERLEVPRWRIERMVNFIITISLDLFEHCPLAPKVPTFNLT